MNCRQCNVSFHPSRHDQIFCSDVCGAAFHREYGTSYTHADLPNQRSKHCEFCDTEFLYNDYANRKGERVPKFCSNKCRQAAFRANKKAQGTKEQETRKKRADDQKRHENYQRRKQANRAQSPQSRDPYAILGVKVGTSLTDIRKAYAALALKFHPDTNPSPDAHEKMVDLNWAFSFLCPRPKQAKR